MKFGQLDTDGNDDITLAELEQAGKDDMLGKCMFQRSEG